MKSRRLHLRSPLAALACLALGACSSGATKSAQPPSAQKTQAIDPGAQVAVIDGQPITYGDLDKEVGTKVRQAEVEYLTKVYDLRKESLDNLITKKLIEGEAKKVGKSADDWFKEFFTNTPNPPEAELKAFYEENVAQMGGKAYEEMQPRIAGFLKQQKAKDAIGKMLETLRAAHGVKVSLVAPELPRIEVEAKGPAKGPATAKVTIIAFSDFQCPYCSRVNPTMDKVMKEYDGKVKLVFRNFPLDFHPMAEKAAEAGACANDQGKFWEMHDKMFGNQAKLTVPDLKESAKGLGLDMAKFEKCLDSGEKKALVDADQKAGSDSGVQGTPAFFVNGIFINGAVPYEQFKEAIDRELTKG
jgi:protein-disulfide isomerase